jgi:hypothetical protein
MGSSGAQQQGGNAANAFYFSITLLAGAFLTTVKKVTQAVGSFKTFMIAAFAALGGISFFKNIVSQYVDMAHTIGRLQTLTDGDIDAIQALGYAVEATGGNIAAFQENYKALQDELANMGVRGISAGLSSGLAQLGIDLTDIEGKTKTVEQLLIEVSRAVENQMAGMSNSEKVNILKGMGFNEDMIVLILKTAGSLDKVMEKNKKLAKVRESDIKLAEQYKKSIHSLNNAWRSFILTFAPYLVNILNDTVFPALRRLAAYFTTKLNTKEFKAMMASVMATLKEAVPMVEKLIKKIGDFVINTGVDGFRQLFDAIKDIVLWLGAFIKDAQETSFIRALLGGKHQDALKKKDGNGNPFREDEKRKAKEIRERGVYEDSDIDRMSADSGYAKDMFESDEVKEAKKDYYNQKTVLEGPPLVPAGAASQTNNYNNQNVTITINGVDVNKAQEVGASAEQAVIRTLKNNI